jgi:peptidoglycan/LPS O-acetylase OafA/YrhL
MRIGSIQGLRGVAVVAVILYHFNLGVTNGFLGVDSFFAISGFVITKVVTSAVDAGIFSLKAFFLRRFDRLFLPLALMVCVSLVAGSFIVSPESFRVSLETAFGAILGVANVITQLQTGDYFASPALANLCLHTWSLGVEEQFYLGFPIILMLALKADRKETLKRPILIISTLSFVFLAAYCSGPLLMGIPVLGSLFGFYSPLVRAWEFGAGALVFLVAVRSKRFAPETSSRNYSLLPLVALIGLYFYPAGVQQYSQELKSIAAVLLTSLVLAASSRENSRNGFLNSTLVMWLGDRSYSLYLWHWPVFVLIGFISGWAENPLSKIFGLLLSVSLGAASYSFIESGWIKSKCVNLKVIWKTGFVTVVLSVLLATSIAHDSAFSAEIAADKARKESLDSGACHDQTIWCVNGVMNASPTYAGAPIYLVGDSNAAMWFSGLHYVAAGLHRDLYSMTHYMCTPFENSFGSTDSSCLKYEKSVLAFFKKAKSGTVIIGFSDVYAFDNRTNGLLVSRSLVRSLTSFAARLTNMGHKVVLIQPIPDFFWAKGAFSPELLSLKQSAGDVDIPLNAEMAENSFPSVFAGIGSTYPTLNTWETLCPGKVCRIIEHGRYVFRDANHVTRFGSRGKFLGH